MPDDAQVIRFAAGRIRLADLRRAARGPARLALDPAWRGPVEAAARLVGDIVTAGRTVYGVNTGFGLLATTGIPLADLRELQVRLVRSHRAGVGPPLPDEVVRLALVLKANSLARGHSGVRPAVVEALIALYEADVLPCVPAKGSVGASGDLAPLAHLCAVLLGEGEARVEGRIVSGADGLRRAGIEPLALGPKEGLALLNGTQISTALALAGLFAAEDAFAAAVTAGAMAVDAAKGSDEPFDDRVHAARGQPGQRDLAAVYRGLLAGSRIRDSHIACDRVQDPYSLRCQPQVMGACLDHMRHAAAVLEREANAVSDNPLVFADGDRPERGVILSGGNFHAEPVALAADALALVLAEIGALSERRVALLVDPHMSGLPAFLVAEPGINSGFMIAQVTAAALAGENKSLAHPTSPDSLPTSANQEDHVSMATHGARRLLEMAGNTAGIVAIELLAAAQGLEFHAPLATSPPLAAVLAALRARVPRLDRDRPFAPDIAAVKEMVAAGRFNAAAAHLMPSLGGGGSGTAA